MRHKEGSTYKERMMTKWGCVLPPPQPPAKKWVPKNPEVSIPVETEVETSDRQWLDSKFPFHPLPKGIETHVNTEVWEEKLRSMSTDPTKVKETSIIQKICGPADQRGRLGGLPTRRYCNQVFKFLLRSHHGHPPHCGRIGQRGEDGSYVGPFPPPHCSTG